MSSDLRVPGRGSVETITQVEQLVPSKRSSKNGSWRPDRPFRNQRGLQIVMRREPHLTAPHVLHVPMRFEVPVLDTFERPYQYSWTTYDTLSEGQKSTPYGKQLLALSINTMLLTEDAAWNADDVVTWNGVHEPQRWLRELRQIMGFEKGTKAQVFRLIVQQHRVWGIRPLNTLAVLTEVDPKQEPGEQGTEYTTISFLEFEEGTTGQRRPQSSQKTRTVKLKATDTLYELAKRYYHQPSAWRVIANANGIKGVTPGSASELAAWAAKRHKTTIRIPARSHK